MYLFSSFKGLLLPVERILYQGVWMVSLYKVNKSSSNEIKIITEKQIVDLSYYVNQKPQDSKMLCLKQLTYSIGMIEIANTVQLFDNRLICLRGPSVIHFPGTYTYLKYFGND